MWTLYAAGSIRRPPGTAPADGPAPAVSYAPACTSRHTIKLTFAPVRLEESL